MMKRCGSVVLTILAVLLYFGAGEAQTRRLPVPSSTAEFDVPGVLDEIAALAETEGGVEEARMALRSHIPGLPARDATLWVQLYGVLGRVEPSVAPDVIRAVRLGQLSEGIAGAELIMEMLPRAGETEAPALMALAAQISATEDADRAAEIRRSFLSSYPDAPEATEVMLSQAQWLLEGEDGEDRKEEGIRLLEELIVSMPQHPLAPEARRLYEAHGGREGSDSGDTGV
jgi:hypothetical protein